LVTPRSKVHASLGKTKKNGIYIKKMAKHRERAKRNDWVLTRLLPKVFP